MGILTFGLINFSLFKIDPSNYQIGFVPRFIHFLYYSTNALLSNNIQDFNPLSSLARLFGTFELLFALILIVILFFIFTSVLSNKHSEELEDVVQSIKRQGLSLEEIINEQYKMTIEEAINELEKIKAGMIQIIFYLSSNIDMKK